MEEGQLCCRARTDLDGAAGKYVAESIRIGESASIQTAPVKCATAVGAAERIAASML